MPSENKNGLTTTICILRHGETDWNASGRLQGRDDVEINDLGRMQAVESALYLGTEAWDVMVSSPLKRAQETAQIIASRLSIAQVHLVEEITERCIVLK